jgi:hypothetical protein
VSEEHSSDAKATIEKRLLISGRGAGGTHFTKCVRAVLSMCPCKPKLDEEKVKHDGLVCLCKNDLNYFCTIYEVFLYIKIV